MIQEPSVETIRYIHCPACGKGKHTVTHLPVGTQTAWYCDEPECGVRFSLTVRPDLTIETLIHAGEFRKRTLVTLRSAKPVTIVVESVRLYPDSTDDKSWIEDERYFHEEHTCPINYLGRVQQVRDDEGDKDPHGIFTFVSCEAWRDLRE